MSTSTHYACTQPTRHKAATQQQQQQHNNKQQHQQQLLQQHASQINEGDWNDVVVVVCIELPGSDFPSCNKSTQQGSKHSDAHKLCYKLYLVTICKLQTELLRVASASHRVASTRGEASQSQSRSRHKRTHTANGSRRRSGSWLQE